MTVPARRTCIACRRVKPKAALLRLVRRQDGAVTVDRTGGASGRGAYVCEDEHCVERALGAGRLAHAFRRPCNARPGLAEEVRGLWQQRRSR